MFSFNEYLTEVKGVVGQSYADMKQNLAAQKETFQKHFNKIPKELSLYREAMKDRYSFDTKNAIQDARGKTISNFRSFAADNSIGKNERERLLMAKNQISALDGTSDKQAMLQNYKYKPNFAERLGDRIASGARKIIPGMSEPDTRITKELPQYYGPNIRAKVDSFKTKFKDAYGNAQQRVADYETSKGLRDPEPERDIPNNVTRLVPRQA